MQKQPSHRQTLKTSIRVIKDLFRAAPVESVSLTVIILFTALLPFGGTYILARVIAEITDILGSPEHLFSDVLIFLIVLYSLSEIAQNILWAAYSYMDREQFFTLGRYFTFNFLKKSSELDLYHYENANQNDLIKKAEDAYSWRPQNLGNRIIWTTDSLIKIIASAGIIASYSPGFFLILVVSTIPSLYVSLKQTDVEFSMWGEDTENRRRYYDGQWFLTDEKSLMELRIFGTKNYIFDMVRRLYDNFNIKQRKVASRKALFESLATTFSKFGILAFWVFLINQTLTDQTTDTGTLLGLLTFYSSTAFAFSGGFESFFRNLARSYEDIKYMVDYYAFIDLENTIKPGTIKLVEKPQPPQIVFQDVDFSYPDSEKIIIKNFNLEINPGEHVAFVGENGAGKTTIIKLLSRFYDVTGGNILVDGYDLRKLDTASWYSQLGILFQSFVKYSSFDVTTNISLQDDVNEELMLKVKEAAEKADAHKFIAELEKGYQQVLDKHYPGGIDLSGGQWQKVALARGFFRDAPILVLDEPTSAIDAKSEAEIFDRLYEFAEGKTVIIISHRFSTVRRADKIYVIDQGQIIEQGTHEELLALNGKYKHAFEKQAEGYK